MRKRRRPSAPRSLSHLRTVPTSYASTNAERLADIYTFFSDKFGALEPPGLTILEVPDDSWEAYAAPGLLLLPARHWSNNINFRLLARTVAQAVVGRSRAARPRG